MKKSLAFILALALSLPTFAYAEIYDCESLKAADGASLGKIQYSVRLSEGAVFVTVTSQEGMSPEFRIAPSGPELFDGRGVTVRVTRNDLETEVTISKETYVGMNTFVTYSAPCTRRIIAE